LSSLSLQPNMQSSSRAAGVPCTKEKKPAAPGLRLCNVAACLGTAFSVLGARHAFSTLLPAILDPIRVRTPRRVRGAIIAKVRAIEIRFASVVHVVWLQWLAFALKASTQSINTILVIATVHADLVPESANPIRPLRQGRWIPPLGEAHALGVVNVRSVHAVAAIARRLAEVVRRTKDFVAICVACRRRRLHTLRKRRVRRALPAARATV